MAKVRTKTNLIIEQLNRAYVIFIMAVFWPIPASANNSPPPPYVSCRDDNAKYRLRSDELQQIVAADQAERSTNALKPGAQIRDRERRERVGAIFGEGCFIDARDFAAAAIVFQHGDQPEHFMQTAMWARRAVDLGDPTQSGLVLMAIDRYLINIGKKQLFATQYSKPSLDAGVCWCLDQTEASFSDKLRLQHGGKPYQQKLEYLRELNAGLKCPLAECSRSLSPSPVGSFPGVW